MSRWRENIKDWEKVCDQFPTEWFKLTTTCNLFVVISQKWPEYNRLSRVHHCTETRCSIHHCTWITMCWQSACIYKLKGNCLRTFASLPERDCTQSKLDNWKQLTWWKATCFQSPWYGKWSCWSWGCCTVGSNSGWSSGHLNHSKAKKKKKNNHQFFLVWPGKTVKKQKQNKKTCGTRKWQSIPFIFLSFIPNLECFCGFYFLFLSNGNSPTPSPTLNYSGSAKLTCNTR